MSRYTPRQFLGCFLDACYVSANLFAHGPGSHTSLHAIVTALAADLTKRLLGKEESKEIAFLCTCPVFTGAGGKASSGRLGF